MNGKKTVTTASAVATALLSAALALPVLGCGGPGVFGSRSPERDADSAAAGMGLVVQSTANAPGWDLGTLRAPLEEVAASGGKVNAVVADSSPSAESATDFSEGKLADSEINRGKRVDAILAREALAPAGEEEVDILEALREAARGLPEGSTIYVVSSGLSTSGALDFTEGLLGADPAEVAAYCAEAGALPDLSGMRVVWYGLGDVAGQQARPSEGQTAAVRAIWEAVLEKCGARAEFSGDPVRSGDGPVADLPHVTAVEMPEVKPYRVSNAAKKHKQVTLSSGELAFVGDSSEYLDKAEAEKVLSGIADELKGNPKVKAKVVGHTATCTWKKGWAQELSELRARAVAKSLVEMGVDESQLEAKGAGDTAPGHIDDIDRFTGLQIPQKAAKNRKVVIEFGEMV